MPGFGNGQASESLNPRAAKLTEIALFSGSDASALRPVTEYIRRQGPVIAG